jgi:hypothetical protein
MDMAPQPLRFLVALRQWTGYSRTRSSYATFTQLCLMEYAKSRAVCPVVYDRVVPRSTEQIHHGCGQILAHDRLSIVQAPARASTDRNAAASCADDDGAIA